MTTLHGIDVWEVAVARLLLENGADANAKTTYHSTPLHSACNEGATGVLLKYGADPTPRDNDYRTPLHRALEWNGAEMARVLLENGVDANARDFVARTPLHLVSSRGYLDGVRLLLYHGADNHARDDGNRTPSAKGHEGVMQLLVEHGAMDQVAITSDEGPWGIVLEANYCRISVSLHILYVTSILDVIICVELLLLL